VSGLETLSPDQRAVLQLILVQGRGYADLAALLKLDPDAVRSRALAGVDALGLPAPDEVDAAERARIADYLLGQQDDGERIVTFAALTESPAACRWAQALRERLAGVAQTELPGVPHAPSANGHAPPAPAALDDPRSEHRGGAQNVGHPGAPRSQPSSRLGGAVLLAGIAALAIVLAVVLIGGGDDDGGSPTTAAQTQTSTQSTRTTATRQPTAAVLAQVNLNPTPSGGQALAFGIVQRSGGRLMFAVQAERLPANNAQELYALWLQGSSGASFLGFVPRPVRDQGTFTVTTELPVNARDYGTVLVTRESTTARPATPGMAILSGTLRLRA